jgi:streptogramin lyase
MVKKYRKVFISLIVMAAFVASAVLVFGATGNTFAKGPSKHPKPHHTPTPAPKHKTPTPVSGGGSHGNGGTADYSTPGGDPWGTVMDGSGNIWVALPGCDLGPTCASGTFPGKIGVFSTSSRTWIRTYTLPSGYGQALFLAFDKSGNLWFAMPMSNSIGEFNISGNAFHQWAVPTAASGPWDVAVDGNGVVWFTEHYSNKIGSFNPSTQKFTEVATPAANSQPYGITVDRSNNVWFTENNPSVALIGEYTAQHSLKEYKIRTSLPGNLLTPHLITVDGNGNVWWSEGWVSKIGELNVSAAKPGTNSGVTEFGYSLTCSNCGSHTSGISVDPSGKVWFTDSLQSTFGYFSNGSFTIFNTPTGNSHPHDGLNSSSSLVWFDEEFAGRLAVKG